MDYWIIVDDRHAGPYSAQQLVDAGLKPDTLVWHEGLADWVAADQVEELRHAMNERDSFAETVVAEAPKVEIEVVQEPVQPCVQETSYSQPTAQPQYAAMQLPDEPCPPAYLAVSIIAMLLCCTPLGIVSVIYSSKVKSAYYRGDLEKAKRCSESAQWWIIATIVLGLLWIPFQMAFLSI